MAHLYNAQLDAFTLYHQQHEAAAPPTPAPVGPVLPALGHAVSGAAGTAISNLALYPLDLIITRLQVQRLLRQSGAATDEYTSMLDAARRIYTTEGGLAAFYEGVAQDTAKSIVDSFLFFLCYNYLRAARLRARAAHALPVLDELAVGAAAGAAAKFVTTPLSNLVTRLQVASMQKPTSAAPTRTKPTMRSLARDIYQTQGIRGFWAGYQAALVLTVNPSLTFGLYELFKRALVPRSRRDDPGARTTFLLAAVSKAIASSVTYPFTLAKKRAQVDGGAAGARRTVLAIILRIYRAEGTAALYDGVWGEILKGFFSNGLTMLVKEQVHGAVVRLYFVLQEVLSLTSPYLQPSTAPLRLSSPEPIPSPPPPVAQAKATARTVVMQLVLAAFASARKLASGATTFVRDEGNDAFAAELASWLDDDMSDGDSLIGLHVDELLPLKRSD